MEDELIEILESFGYPVIRQGSISESDEYPSNFFTFWNNDSPIHVFYDNEEHGIDWDFDVNFYSIDPALTYNILAQARKKLREHNWIIQGAGYDVASDEPTHTGRGMRALYLQTGGI